MANVKRCDRCGKIYERKNCNIRIEVRHATGSLVCDYDLCPDCAEHFRSENNETEEEVLDESGRNDPV